MLFALFKDKGLSQNLSLLKNHKPSIYHGKTTFYQGKKSFYHWLRTAKRWQKNCQGEYHICLLEGDHDNFLRSPHQQTLANDIINILSFTKITNT